MPRAAAKTASNIGAQATANANSMYNTLEPEANSLINSQGYDPATLAAITNSTMGATNAPYTNAKSQLARNTARTKNQASDASQQDVLAQQQGIAGGNAANQVQMENQQYKTQQQQMGLNLMSGMYGANLGTEVPAVSAQTTASPGWAQTLSGIMQGIGSMVPKG